MLEINKLAITKGEQTLFSSLSFATGAGEITAILGPSGIGKSTLLAAIGGHIDPIFNCSGAVQLNGRDMMALPAEARRIGVLFQDVLLFPHLSVGQNLAFGLSASHKDRRAIVEATLDQAGLAGFYDRDPATLSGGQRARVALMRTLLAEPLALLLDEPFSRLDTALRTEIRDFTFDHIRARNIPSVIVTHDPSDAEATDMVTKLA